VKEAEWPPSSLGEEVEPRQKAADAVHTRAN
jgi:hypothetical protein